ncbi:MAG: DUF285 domain-containing protein [Candidatus Peribacteria bacterium]|nr:DUF285 domain-containing protein [Candidatus Peribacteria bacterium]
MQTMFYNASSFNQPMNHFNTENVTSLQNTFRATSFNQPLDQRNVSSVTNMTSMFQ